MPLLKDSASYYTALAAADKPTPGASRPLAYMVRRPTQPPTVLAILPRFICVHVYVWVWSQSVRVCVSVVVVKLHCHWKVLFNDLHARLPSLTTRTLLFYFTRFHSFSRWGDVMVVRVFSWSVWCRPSAHLTLFSDTPEPWGNLPENTNRFDETMGKEQNIFLSIRII